MRNLGFKIDNMKIIPDKDQKNCQEANIGMNIDIPKSIYNSFNLENSSPSNVDFSPSNLYGSPLIKSPNFNKNRLRYSDFGKHESIAKIDNRSKRYSDFRKRGSIAISNISNITQTNSSKSKKKEKKCRYLKKKNIEISNPFYYISPDEKSMESTDNLEKVNEINRKSMYNYDNSIEKSLYLHTYYVA